VDLIDPLSEPSTYRQPPVYSDAFAPLLERWPNRDATADGGTRVIWIDPRQVPLCELAPRELRLDVGSSSVAHLREAPRIVREGLQETRQLRGVLGTKGDSAT